MIRWYTQQHRAEHVTLKSAESEKKLLKERTHVLILSSKKRWRNRRIYFVPFTVSPSSEINRNMVLLFFWGWRCYNFYHHLNFNFALIPAGVGTLNSFICISTFNFHFIQRNIIIEQLPLQTELKLGKRRGFEYEL